jgi:hypothetical protein
LCEELAPRNQEFLVFDFKNLLEEFTKIKIGYKDHPTKNILITKTTRRLHPQPNKTKKPLILISPPKKAVKIKTLIKSIFHIFTPLINDFPRLPGTSKQNNPIIFFNV